MTCEELIEKLCSMPEDDIIRLGAARDEIMRQRQVEQRRRKAEKAHKYNIGYSPAQERYYTRHPDDYKKKIYRKQKEDLLDFLANYYFPVEKEKEEITLSSLFPDWIKYKTTVTDSPNTITVLEKHYRKYFEGTDFFNKPLKEITIKDLKLWANQLIRDNQLTSKQWQTIKTIPKQIFEYAIDDGIIDVNPFPSLRITVKFAQVVKPKSEDQVYNTEELDLLFKDLWDSFTETHQVRFLAVLWNFYAGLRAGELSGLMWSDVDLKSKAVTVRREVVCIDRDKLQAPAYKEAVANGDYTILSGQEGKKWLYVMVTHTKTHKERTIDLPEPAIEILKEIPKTSLYVFADKEAKSLTVRQINSVLEDACVHIAQKMGAKGTVAELRKTVKIKRSHKIRKTYASTLSAAGLPIDRIREYLGHSSLQTTLGYLYDPLSDTERREILEDAFAKHPKNSEKHPKTSDSSKCTKIAGSP